MARSEHGRFRHQKAGVPVRLCFYTSYNGAVAAWAMLA